MLCFTASGAVNFLIVFLDLFDLREDQIQRNQKLKLIGKAIQPSEAEIQANPRSRSAVLRVAERI